MLSYLASLLSYVYKRDDYMEFFFFQTLKIESENMSDLKITQGIWCTGTKYSNTIVHQCVF